MAMRELYHGTTGDNILAIIRDRWMMPGADGTIFFSQHRFDSVLMHGGDLKRKAAFAVKVRVHIPPESTVEQRATHGVADTLVVHATAPIPAEVLELYVRLPGATSVQVLKSLTDILKFLQG